MDMSPAALPPIQPDIRESDRLHPLFVLYQQHRNVCTLNLLECESFADWLRCYERNLRDREIARHPRYQSFVEWMQTNQGGARKCPAGAFPQNFHFWLEGGRW